MFVTQGFIEKCDITSTFTLSWWRHQMETFSTLLALCAGNFRSPVNSPHKGQWRGALMFSLICEWTNWWVNNREAGDLRHHRAHYDVIVMFHNTTGLMCTIVLFLWFSIPLVGLEQLPPFVLTLVVLGLEYSGRTRSMRWLLMPWLLSSPGHYQPPYSLYRSLLSMGNNFNYLRHLNVEELYYEKMQISFLCFLKTMQHLKG